VGSFSAFGDVVVIFDRLDQVAPPTIEPDVNAIYNSLQHEQGALANEASNPLGSLVSGVVTTLMTSGSLTMSLHLHFRELQDIGRYASFDAVHRRPLGPGDPSTHSLRTQAISKHRMRG